jgi:hypothetical protein
VEGDRLVVLDRNVGTCASFELTTTGVHYDWEHYEHTPCGDITVLSLSARPDGRVRGTVRQTGGLHHSLRIDDWELVGPPELGPAWSVTSRRALAQLRLRVAGRPHLSPDAGGRWDVSVRHRLRVTGAPDLPSQLTDWTFVPREMFVDVSTNGAGSLLLFGAGPPEINSARYSFTAGLGGIVAFDQLDPDDRVPDWAQGPALEATRSAFDLRVAAARLLVDESTGARA